MTLLYCKPGAMQIAFPAAFELTNLYWEPYYDLGEGAGRATWVVRQCPVLVNPWYWSDGDTETTSNYSVRRIILFWGRAFLRAEQADVLLVKDLLNSHCLTGKGLSFCTFPIKISLGLKRIGYRILQPLFVLNLDWNVGPMERCGPSVRTCNSIDSFDRHIELGIGSPIQPWLWIMQIVMSRFRNGVEMLNW